MFDEFDEFILELETDGDISESTENTRERELDFFCEWLEGEGITDANDVSRGDIIDYVDYLVDEGYARSTIVRAKYASISAAFNYLYRERFVDDNPVARLQRKGIKAKAEKDMTAAEKKDEELSEKDHLSKEQVYELAEKHVPKPTDRNELLIKLMFWTGIRVSEVVLIDIGEDGQIEGEGTDIDMGSTLIDIYSPKTDSTRQVAYPSEEINPLLRDWVNNGRLRYKYANESNKLFLGRKKPLTESGVGRVVEKAAENMGSIQDTKRTSQDGREYNRVTPHLLRHSHAMHYHNKEGVSLDRLKDHLGHSSVDITEDFYAETTSDALIDTFGG